jgi:hypothetical protein
MFSSPLKIKKIHNSIFKVREERVLVFFLCDGEKFVLACPVANAIGDNLSSDG